MFTAGHTAGSAAVCKVVRVNGIKETECEDRTVHNTSIRAFLKFIPCDVCGIPR